MSIRNGWCGARWRVLAVAAFTAGLWAWACTTPLYQYASESWSPDDYQVLVLHRGPLSAADEKVAVELETKASVAEAPANSKVLRVDLAKPLPQPWDKWCADYVGAELPCLVVLYPEDASGRSVAWSGPLSRDAVAALLDSPARRALVAALLRGDSVVWLLVHGGAAGTASPAVERLTRALRQAEADVRLPEPAPGDPPVRPFRTAVVPVATGDPAERVFVQMLVPASGPGKAGMEPVVFPVFGRGRALCTVAVGDDFEQRVAYVSNFLASSCSCEVKAQNPGVDLLLTADWSPLTAVQADTVAEVPLMAVAVEAASPATPVTAAIEAGPPPPAERPAPRLTPLVRNLLALAVGVVVLAGGGGLLLRRGSGRRHGNDDSTGGGSA